MIDTPYDGPRVLTIASIAASRAAGIAVQHETRQRTQRDYDAVQMFKQHMTIRSWSALVEQRLYTFEAVAQKTAAELLWSRNFGRKSLHEVEVALAKHGLVLVGDKRTADEVLKEDVKRREKASGKQPARPAAFTPEQLAGRAKLRRLVARMTRCEKEMVQIAKQIAALEKELSA